MVRLTLQTNDCIQIDNALYPKSSLICRGDGEGFEIVTVGYPQIVVPRQKFDQWYLDGTKAASYAILETYLKTNAYRA